MDPVLGGALSNPLVYAVVVIVLLLVFTIKKLAEVSTPLGAAVRWLRDRELNKIRRQRELESERRKNDREHESAELQALRADVEFLMRDRQDSIRRQQMSDRQSRMTAEWINEWVPQARALGLAVPDPPELVELPALHLSNPDPVVQDSDDEEWTPGDSPRSLPRGR